MRPDAGDRSEGPKHEASGNGSEQTRTTNQIREQVEAPGRRWRLASWRSWREYSSPQGGRWPPRRGHEVRLLLGLELDLVGCCHSQHVARRPNGSRLSCGRNRRWRKAVEPQKKRPASEATQFLPACERPPASSAC